MRYARVVYAHQLLLLTIITGGVEERGDRARGARHPAPAADGDGEGAQPEGGRQGALKTHSLTVLLLATAPNI